MFLFALLKKIKTKISRKKKLLQTNKYLLEDIIANMPGYIYWKNAESQYMGCNKNLANISGLTSPKNIIGKYDNDFLWGQNESDNFKLDDQEVLSTGKTHISEYKLPVSDNKSLTIRTEKRPLYNKKGKAIAILGVALDVTAEKETEMLRLEKAKAEQAQKNAEQIVERMKELALTIAHEMRTPLFSMRLLTLSAQKYITLLLNEETDFTKNNLPSEQLTDKQKTVLANFGSIMENEIKKAFLTINLLLENVNSGNFNHTNLITCSAAETIKIALERYPLTDEQRCLIHHEDMTDFLFQGDQELMIHLFFNLLKNSLYYIASKGEIYIWSEQKEFQNELHFKDTGKGIAAEILPYIFDQFYSRTYHGTGLGLTFCKRVMESNGGNIQCHSIEGDYTEFVLSFPKISGNHSAECKS